ncbi:FHA domain-containing protein [Pengzhenrongella sicca]|uniref:FHA domain-containing protein n=1 Tax=Pengzhenrongella sicca TaxID=2819238 RepID=A0A8A4ZC51_9MICO|nr:FHA domain-containing protein [Pengzhenrongella sicca]QTE28991.1 FHA domain-containing protein [Pengzhenrongella sicca]
MSSGGYVPGSQLAVVEVHGMALLPASTPDDVLAAVRAALGPAEPDGERAAVLLEALTLGTRLSNLPPFAVAVLAAGRVDLLVRGHYRAVVTAPRPAQVDGLHVTSWREESVDAPTLVELVELVELARDDDGSGRTLTLDRGVALAASVRLALPPTGLERELGVVPAAELGPAAAELVPAVGGTDDIPVVGSALELTRSGETVAGEPGIETAEQLVTGVPGAAAGPVPNRGGDGSGETDYGFLWDHTVVHDIEHAAVRAPAHASDPAPGPEASAGDHDGETIHLAELLGSPPAPVVPAPSGSGVLSRFCAQGHANAPHAVACGTCGGPFVGDPKLGTRPALGRLRLSSGATVDLDRTVILGRRPQASRVEAGDIPQLVAVGGREISRSHLELRVEDWNVLAVELGSRNGTLLLRPGQPPVRLVPNNPVPVRAGDQFDLGESIIVTAEDVP